MEKYLYIIGSLHQNIELLVSCWLLDFVYDFTSDFLSEGALMLSGFLWLMDFGGVVCDFILPSDCFWLISEIFAGPTPPY